MTFILSVVWLVFVIVGTLMFLKAISE